MKSDAPETTLTRRWAREWALLWFGKVHPSMWARYDSDRLISPRAWRKAPVEIWRGQIGDLL